MTFPALMMDGTASALFAAAVLAAMPQFQPERTGWLARFGWFLLRYALPFVSLPVVFAWLVLSGRR